MAAEVDRRVAGLAIAAVAGAGVGALGACDSSGTSKGAARRSTGPAASPSPSAAAPSAAASPAPDRALRNQAISDERRLLAACAGPQGVEPFATMRTVRRTHLRALTGVAPAEPASTTTTPAAARLAIFERAATDRRSDCVRASASLAPLLAGLAASGDVAVALLTP